MRKVLRETGHIEDARQVAIALEDRRRHCGLIGQCPKEWSRPKKWLHRTICTGFHWLLGKVVGYGYRPMRLVYLLLGVWLACALIYDVAANAGIFAPSNPLVFQNPSYRSCALDRVATTADTTAQANWYFCADLPGEYTGFSPLAYSLNVLLPVVDLQQSDAWGPITPTPSRDWFGDLYPIPWGYLVRLIIWCEELFGWVASLLLIAVVSGVTKRQDE